MSIAASMFWACPSKTTSERLGGGGISVHRQKKASGPWYGNHAAMPKDCTGSLSTLPALYLIGDFGDHLIA
jgi:hypothetical protein